MPEILLACFQLDEFYQRGCLRRVERYRGHFCLVHAAPLLAIRICRVSPICPESDGFEQA
jgi:hypothetical protein